MQEITFTIRFFGGAGGFYIFGENIPQGSHISSADGDIQHLRVQQMPGFKVATMTGVGPADGNVDVQVTNAAGTILSPYEKNRYPAGPFMGSVFYEID